VLFCAAFFSLALAPFAVPQLPASDASDRVFTEDEILASVARFCNAFLAQETTSVLLIKSCPVGVLKGEAFIAAGRGGD
jgi:hypothetical protein